MYILRCILLLLLAAKSLAQSASSTSGASVPQSTACGDIVNTSDLDDQFVFNASLAYECLTSVPFNADVATRFLQYYNDTFQFQSTLSYLKNPPTSYQQPAVDVLQGLSELQAGIDNGIFSNEYKFEAALQTLLQATHDGHINLAAGILTAFSFASPREIISVSIDGVQPPKVYLTDDLFYSNYFEEYTPSPIATINGIDVVTYLTTFADKNSFGTLEPHADWNQLFTSPAQEIQLLFNVFSGGATFYPGDTITFGLENGTEIPDHFLAIYNSLGPTGPLETGGDFYNFFVLGFYPASFDPDLVDNNLVNISTTTPSDTPTPTPTATPSPTSTATLSWDNSAYPNPDIAQPDLGEFGGGYVSGYFFRSSSRAVLSIPSFDEYGDALNTFDETIANFISAAQNAGLNKIVIDLQSNSGGQPLLAISTFKHFFPNIDPFAGSRLRAHHAADVMGNTITSYFDSLDTSDPVYEALAANEWVSSDRLNAEVDPNRNFSSWQEFFGPHEYNGDAFTTIQRYNLSSSVFDISATNDDDGGDDGNFTVFGFTASTADEPPFNAEDIILLTDGLCDSACTLFLESMHHEAGVRVVVVGGRPTTGPMQSASGSRGALDYSVASLDANIEFAQLLLNSSDPPSPDTYFLPNRTEENDVYINYASINLRDQIRVGGQTPLQFAYDAADCRIWFTPQTVYNYSALWNYAADAIWNKPSLCIAGSTGFATTGTNETNFVGPASSVSASASSINVTSNPFSLNTSSIPYLTDLNNGLEDLVSRSFQSQKTCNTVADCGNGGKGQDCVSVPNCSKKICVAICSPVNAPCGNSGKCRPSQALKQRVGNQQLAQGFCEPPPGSGCSTQPIPRVKIGPPPPNKK
ncbi:hypothetical protein V8E54_014446 [Elaphomyces granulatus]